MTADLSLWTYFAQAGWVVKFVMLLLIAASVAAWTVIFQRTFIIQQAQRALAEFEDTFWSGLDLSRLYTELTSQHTEMTGAAAIFMAGFREYARLRKQSNISGETILEGAQRAMRIAYSHEADRLEQGLTFLATVGSSSPYIGLFGTVWGIMTSFHALGNASQATIAMVAPGISEALMATAMGLFAAIPAVIAYNRLAHRSERLLNRCETFQEEFSNILHRQAYSGKRT